MASSLRHGIQMSVMAPLVPFTCRKVLFSYFLFLLFICTLLCCTTSADSQHQAKRTQFLGRRTILEIDQDQEDVPLPKKKPNSNLNNKNQTKVIKSSQSSKNQTQFSKTSNSTKTKSNLNSKIELKRLNSTSKFMKLNETSTKTSNTTKTSMGSSKKTIDLTKLSTPNNKTTKSDKKLMNPQPKNLNKIQKSKTTHKQKLPSWLEQHEDDDLVAEFRDLPIRFQETLIPDLEKISTTSKAYISKANKEITKGFKPYVGNKYASTLATTVSFAFILIPFILVSLIFNHIKAYFSLQRLLIFIQVYLSIYFSILCLSSVLTGLEPLRFFYATSESAYVCVQVMQTLGYVVYLLLLLMYLVLVFSKDSRMGSKFLGLAQTVVGYAVGLHYYVVVLHQVVLHQPPMINWKVHGIYATCFLVMCLSARAGRPKKAYLEDGGAEGKKS